MSVRTGSAASSSVTATLMILIQAVRYHSSGRSRRQMRSGIQMRAAIDATFASKRNAG